jgi:hypothetical protein
MAIAPAAAFFAASSDVHPFVADRQPEPVFDGTGPSRVEVMATAPIAYRTADAAVEAAPGPGPESAPIQLVSAATPDQMTMAASRYRTFNVPTLLPLGRAPETGLQIKTILASRAISAAFPEIHNMGGVRPDALRWHPDGLALDVMIPNPSSPEGIALGDQIVAYALANAERFGLQDAIWRGTYYTPSGPSGSGYGHFDHVHITTIGGGYPTGDEDYYR